MSWDRFTENAPGDFFPALDREMFNVEPMPERDCADNEPAPETCPVRIYVLTNATTVGEMCDALTLHKLEYCEACGQFDGFVRVERRAAA